MGPAIARHLRGVANRRFPAGRKGLTALILLVCLASGASGSRGLAAEDREYAIKAAFLFHFTHFIEWPAEAMPPEGEPIRIGILEPNPFNTLLDELVEGEKAGNRSIEVVRAVDFDTAAEVQILFVPRAVGIADRRNLIKRLNGSPVLLVGEDLAFIRAGGAVALVRQEERVVIAINRKALEAAGLSASSRLLRLAHFLDETEEK